MTFDIRKLSSLIFRLALLAALTSYIHDLGQTNWWLASMVTLLTAISAYEHNQIRVLRREYAGLVQAPTGSALHKP